MRMRKRTMLRGTIASLFLRMFKFSLEQTNTEPRDILPIAEGDHTNTDPCFTLVFRVRIGYNRGQSNGGRLHPKTPAGLGKLAGVLISRYYLASALRFFTIYIYSLIRIIHYT